MLKQRHPLFMLAEVGCAAARFEMGADDLERHFGKRVRVEVGPFAEFDGAGVFGMDEFLGAVEEGRELLLQIREFELFAESKLLFEGSVGKEREEEGDEGRFLRVIFDRSQTALDFMKRQVFQGRENRGEQAIFMERDEHGSELAESEPFAEFLADPLDGDSRKEFVGMGADGGLGGRLDGEVESAGEPDRPDHPEPVFFNPFVRVPDGADDFRFEILPALDEIEEFFFQRIVEHPVNGEVAPFCVFGRGGKFDFAGAPPVENFFSRKG